MTCVANFIVSISIITPVLWFIMLAAKNGARVVKKKIQITGETPCQSKNAMQSPKNKVFIQVKCSYKHVFVGSVTATRLRFD